MRSSILSAGPCKTPRLNLVLLQTGIVRRFDGAPRRMSRLQTVGVIWLSAVVASWTVNSAAHATLAERHAVTVEARDLLTDAPLPGVALKLSVAGGVKLEAATDVNGIARFEYAFPGSSNRGFFTVTARRAGLVPLAIHWNQTPPSPTPPERLRFDMEKATTISGRVIDQDSHPMADAVVVVSVKKSYPKSDQRVAVSYESIKTDANGRWSFKSVPAHPDTVELATYHYLCLTEHSSFYPEAFKPLSALRDGSAVSTLRRGTLIEGTVVSPDGRPVANAEICYGDDRGYGNSIPPLKADSQGKFTLGIKPGTHATLLASSPGFAPTLERTKVGREPLRLHLALDRPHSIRGRVVDPAGTPIVNADVTVYWSGSDRSPRSQFGSAVTHRLRTGKDGRFDWNEAPGAGVHATLHANGFSGRNDFSLASDNDHEIVLVPPTAVKGTVVIRQSGEPIPRFRLAVATVGEPAGPFIWQNQSEVARDAKTAKRRVRILDLLVGISVPRARRGRRIPSRRCRTLRARRQIPRFDIPPDQSGTDPWHGTQSRRISRSGWLRLSGPIASRGLDRVPLPHGRRCSGQRAVAHGPRADWCRWPFLASAREGKFRTLGLDQDGIGARSARRASG